MVLAAAALALGLAGNGSIDLDSGWEFARVDSGALLTPGSSSAEVVSAERIELGSVKSDDWKPATLPHASWIRPLNTSEIWQGVTYYKREISVPTGMLDKHLELRLGPVVQSGQVWLNGRLAGRRYGGYIPMVLDLTGKLMPTNELVVRTDNRPSDQFPPGKPQDQLDFMYGAGIPGHAKLVAKDKVHITDPLLGDDRYGGGVIVTFPKVSKDSATVRVRVNLANEFPTAKDVHWTVILMNSEGQALLHEMPLNLAAQSTRWVGHDIKIDKPLLWSPDDPELYSVTVSVSGKGIYDKVSFPVGIRKIEVSREKGFVLNGKPLRLVGTNRHQDYPWVGPALSDAANERDAVLIKKSGHNIVRLSHYPQSPAFLDACDRLGILTIPCIAGWQFMGHNPSFQADTLRDIRDLIRRDRNHPSAAFWEVSLNETYPGPEMAKSWADAARDESPDHDILVAGDSTKGAPWDVAYNSWKEGFIRPQDALPDKPGYIREYGDYEFGGGNSSTRVPISGGYPALLQAAWNEVWSYNRYRPQYPWTMGAGTWEMFDHNVPWDFSVSCSGLADLFRRPKPAFWFYESQNSGEPFVKIAGVWQSVADGKKIVVFTNCQRVNLLVNGKLVKGSPFAVRRGQSTGYGDATPFDGSNTEHLKHPPMVLSCAFEPGEIQVQGISDGETACSDTVWTAGAPTGVRVAVDDLGVEPTTNDLVFVRARLVDSAGHTVVGSGDEVRFEVVGGSLVSPAPVPMQMGVASALVRTPMTRGKVKVTARWNGHQAVTEFSTR